MPKATRAESLLARLTTPDRAAAILGDLTELAATRGRRYFWATYLRTLITLGWRTPVAFAGGIVAFNLLVSLLERWILHQPDTWRISLRNAPAIFQITPLLAAVAIALWFTFPYALVRYGFHDRFVRLAAVTFLLSTGTFFFYVPIVSLVLALLTVLTLIAALVSTTWRRPAIVLIATGATGAAAFAASAFAAALGFQFVIEYVRLPQFRLLFWEIAVFSSMFAVALICSRLHARLLDPNPAGGTHVEPA